MISDERKRYLDQFVNGLPAGEELTQEEVNYIIDNALRNATTEDWNNALNIMLGYFEKVEKRRGKWPPPQPPAPLPELHCPNGHRLVLHENLDGTINGECSQCLTLWKFKRGGAEMEQIILPPDPREMWLPPPPIIFPSNEDESE